MDRWQHRWAKHVRGAAMKGMAIGAEAGEVHAGRNEPGLSLACFPKELPSLCGAYNSGDQLL